MYRVVHLILITCLRIKWNNEICSQKFFQWEELFNVTNDKQIQFNSIKKSLTAKLGKNSVSRRKLEKIENLKQLVEELESNLQIFPEKKEIVQFLKLIKLLKEEYPNIIEKEFYRKADLLTHNKCESISTL